jgi:hypothetical protein
MLRVKVNNIQSGEVEDAEFTVNNNILRVKINHFMREWHLDGAFLAVICRVVDEGKKFAIARDHYLLSTEEADKLRKFVSPLVIKDEREFKVACGRMVELVSTPAAEFYHKMIARGVPEEQAGRAMVALTKSLSKSFFQTVFERFEQ